MGFSNPTSSLKALSGRRPLFRERFLLVCMLYAEGKSAGVSVKNKEDKSLRCLPLTKWACCSYRKPEPLRKPSTLRSGRGLIRATAGTSAKIATCLMLWTRALRGVVDPAEPADFKLGSGALTGGTNTAVCSPRQ